MRRTLLFLGVVTAVLAAGCIGASPTIESRSCGDVAGAGGCTATISNPTDNPMEVEVTVRAIATDGGVAATNTETVTIPANGQEEVTVTASSLGTEIVRYEFEARNAN